MKKSLLLVGGAVLASVILSGCAGVSVPGATTAGPVFFADYAAPAVVNSYKGPCTIVKRGVTASATFKSFFTCINEGDVSYATLKKQALQQAQGANELIDVQIDYKVNTIFGINTIKVNLTATAVKTK